MWSDFFHANVVLVDAWCPNFFSANVISVDHPLAHPSHPPEPRDRAIRPPEPYRQRFSDENQRMLPHTSGKNPPARLQDLRTECRKLDVATTHIKWVGFSSHAVILGKSHPEGIRCSEMEAISSWFSEWQKKRAQCVDTVLILYMWAWFGMKKSNQSCVSKMKQKLNTFGEHYDSFPIW